MGNVIESQKARDPVKKKNAGKRVPPLVAESPPQKNNTTFAKYTERKLKGANSVARERPVLMSSRLHELGTKKKKKDSSKPSICDR